MKQDSIKEYTQLYNRLVQERDEIAARLDDINNVFSGNLSGEVSPAKFKGSSTAKKNGRRKLGKKSEKPAKPVKKVRRKMSAASRKKIADAQKRRWAKAKLGAKK